MNLQNSPSSEKRAVLNLTFLAIGFGISFLIFSLQKISVKHNLGYFVMLGLISDIILLILWTNSTPTKEKIQRTVESETFEHPLFLMPLMLCVFYAAFESDTIVFGNENNLNNYLILCGRIILIQPFLGVTYHIARRTRWIQKIYIWYYGDEVFSW